MTQRTCARSGCEVTFEANGRGRPRKFCSKDCTDADWIARNRETVNEWSRESYARRRPALSEARRSATRAARAALERICAGCDRSIPAERSMSAKFCSRDCAARHTPRDNPALECSYADCDRPVRARGICSMHYRREARASGREAAPVWDERRRMNHQKRRAMKAGADAEPISSREVYLRDDWTCGLCAERVDPDRAWPDPMSASLDHIVPLSKGGPHTLANVQCAHLSCNVQKGNRVVA